MVSVRLSTTKLSFFTPREENIWWSPCVVYGIKRTDDECQGLAMRCSSQRNSIVLLHTCWHMRRGALTARPGSAVWDTRRHNSKLT
ncbi:MAG: hypothetical protein GPOALKHO_001980 [Sodalis sp.]|nr:MAG: hypothetical protein GPOALKHO_001980 [Sodalis sp.]